MTVINHYSHERYRGWLAKSGKRVLAETAEWWPDGETHGHMVYFVFDVTKDLTGADFEDACMDLAEAMRDCDLHHTRPGKGHKPHTMEQIKQAMKDAMDSFLYRKEMGIIGYERWEIAQKQKYFKKWGSHMPAAVIFPSQDDPTGPWMIMTPDADGNPMIQQTKAGTFEKEVRPPTDSKSAAWPDAHGIGFIRQENI